MFLFFICLSGLVIIIQISDLTNSMKKSWPSLACPSSDGLSFWSHEWEKHGTCSESVLNEHDYFQASLNLKNQVDLLQTLKTAGDDVLNKISLII